MVAWRGYRGGDAAQAEHVVSTIKNSYVASPYYSALGLN